MAINFEVESWKLKTWIFEVVILELEVVFGHAVYLEKILSLWVTEISPKNWYGPILRTRKFYKHNFSKSNLKSMTKPIFEDKFSKSNPKSIIKR